MLLVFYQQFDINALTRTGKASCDQTKIAYYCITNLKNQQCELGLVQG